MKIKALLAIAIVLSIGIAGCTISEGNPDDVDSVLTAPIDEGDDSAGALFEPADDDDTEVTVDDDGGDDNIDDDDKCSDTETEVELSPLTISGDDDIEVGALADFEQIYSAHGGNDEEFDWEVTGAPDWIEHEVHGDRRIIIRGKAPFLMVDQSFTLKITAIDAMDESFEVTEEVTVKVLGANIPPIKAEFYGSQCNEPLKIHIERNVNKSGMGEPLQVKSVVIGDAGHNVMLRVTRGDDKAPMGNVTWSWESKVDDSYYCKKKGRKGPAKALDELDDIKYIGKAYPIGNDAYYPITLDGEDYTFGEECVDDDEGQWTRNHSWRLSSEGPGDGSAERDVKTEGDALSLKGDFIFHKQPMPVLKFYDDGVEDLDRKPIERLIIKASDGCKAGDTGEIELEFQLSYPKDKVSDIIVDLKYENAESYDKETHSAKDDYCDDGGKGWCDEFLHSNIGLFFHYKKKGDDYLGLGMHEDTVGYAAFRLQTLEEKGDGSYQKRVTAMNKDKTIHNVKHIQLRTDGVGTIKEETKWILIVPVKVDVHKYDDIDIKSIDFETSYWEARYYDIDDSDEWTWSGDKLHDYPISYWLSGMDEMDTRNDDGGLFHRKTWMPMRFVEGSFEAELTLDE